MILQRGEDVEEGLRQGRCGAFHPAPAEAPLRYRDAEEQLVQVR